MKDSITTGVEANGYAVWDIQQTFDGFKLELITHLDDEASSDLCGQFPLSADYMSSSPKARR
ncbi:MAG: hypothetical protein Q4D23_02900 [Bacteroidales bacterium]|nr:hypothetical protein [Bacteroidales bacterium]